MFVVINKKDINLFPKDIYDYSDPNNHILVNQAPFKFKPLAQPLSSSDKFNQVFGSIVGDVEAFKNSGIEYIEIVELLDREFRELLTNKREYWGLEQFLPKMKELKIQNFSKNCESEIINGFTSNALGEVYYYQSNRDDQLNLIGVVTAGEDTLYKSSLDNQIWEYKLHTINQLKKVLSDGKAIKTNLLQKFTNLKNQIISTQNIEELEGIKW